MIHFRSPLNIAFVVLGVLATVAGFILVPADMALPAHWGLDGQPDAARLLCQPYPADMVVTRTEELWVKRA